MLEPVAAGVDGSAESLAAAEWAAREAARRERPLMLVHAENWRPRPDHDEAARAARHSSARRVLREAEARARSAAPGIRPAATQVEGPATAALVQAAEQAELLVLGSRGLTGFTGFLVGSVALGVVARATRPVVLVRAGEDAVDEHLPAEDGTPSSRTGYRDVVLGVDLGDPCDEVIRFAFEAARLRRARLRAVHAFRAPGPLGLGPGDVALLDPPRRAGEWQGFLSAVLQPWHDKYPEVEVLATAVADRAPNALLRAATGASLLVLGRHLTERPTGPCTGPVTHAALQHVGCPVAVVPHV
ncbi:stress-inducible protein [Streptomyces ruber]|uniref:Stress-inducible protein n=2 Tax=Streptomyces TaxID=1883 RepID=A0A918EWF9_9ACTN|nr:universal stress protein [Streptomyces ruber]GGQ82094.1 stress-inducible protein [Streptomyces ruber]